jgi:hypothetical protein
MALEPATAPPRPWYARLPAALVGLAFATAALLAGFWTQFAGERRITDPSDLRIVLPLAGLALVAAIVSLARGERPRGFAIGALGMAAAAPLLGWVVLVGAVVVATLVVGVILAKLN